MQPVRCAVRPSTPGLVPIAARSRKGRAPRARGCGARSVAPGSVREATAGGRARSRNRTRVPERCAAAVGQAATAPRAAAVMGCCHRGPPAPRGVAAVPAAKAQQAAAEERRRGLRAVGGSSPGGGGALQGEGGSSEGAGTEDRGGEGAATSREDGEGGIANEVG
ncbi:hypothetical protein PVAP13_1KG319105 [Panicum virgatum]|uniref:Uncharacterized protein n=1 Tax=Panicum virgatum TaxID=38727 RepID=A0A8T0XTZ8_PANVG|nr:hypothetical protein PVAP13_1KG319105 [Panicum virgatum]